MLAYSKNVQNVSLIYPKIRNGNGDNLNVNTVDSYIANLIVSLKVVMYSYRRLLMMMMVMMMIMMMVVMMMIMVMMIMMMVMMMMLWW